MGMTGLVFAGRSLFPGCLSGANGASDVYGTVMVSRAAAWVRFVLLYIMNNLFVRGIFILKTGVSGKSGVPAEYPPELSNNQGLLIVKYSQAGTIKFNPAEIKKTAGSAFFKAEKRDLPAFFEKVFHYRWELKDVLTALNSDRKCRSAMVLNKKFNEEIMQQYKITEGAFKWEAQG